MRRVRLDLEREHARILRRDPDKLFDWETLREEAHPSDIAVSNTDRPKPLSHYLTKIARLGGYLARANDSRLTDIGLGAIVGAEIVGN
jgi:hypothetical protein